MSFLEEILRIITLLFQWVSLSIAHLIMNGSTLTVARKKCTATMYKRSSFVCQANHLVKYFERKRH